MMTVAEEVAYLSEVTGQSAADLLAVPASTYYAIKDRALRRLLRLAEQARRDRSAHNRAALMADLKRQMGR